jgi:glutamyl-tRNA reductase
MYSQFRAISLSHKTAPLAVRETFALNEDEVKFFSLQLKDLLDISEALVVSTCNRTEVYYMANDDLSHDVLKALTAYKVLGKSEQYIPYFSFLDQTEAIQHLFEVSMGLHSTVVGDLQISNQIKHAYQASADLNLAGPFLHRLMHTIFFASKRVAQETEFRTGAASTSYAAVELIEELTATIARPKVLIVGLGEIGSDVFKTLADKNIADITLCNRTRQKAETLANGLAVELADFVNVEKEIAQADVVVSSVVMASPLIDKEMLLKSGVLSYKYLIDLSVPRSVSSDAEQVPGVLVYNIDTLRSRADEALQKRLDAMPHVRAIIAQALIGFEDWSKEMMVSPTIQKLKNSLEQIRKEELSRHLKNLTDHELEKVDKITQGMIQKILKLPVLQLKAACKRGEAETLIDVLNNLFNLEQQEDTHGVK